MRGAKKESAIIVMSVIGTILLKLSNDADNTESKSFSSAAIFGLASGLAFVAVSRWIHSEKTDENQKLRELNTCLEGSKTTLEGKLRSVEQTLETTKNECDELRRQNEALASKNSFLAKEITRRTRAETNCTDPAAMFQRNH